MSNKREQSFIQPREKKWKIRYRPGYSETEQSVEKLMNDLGVSRIMAVLLFNRGMTDPARARSFLNCNDTVLHDPMLLNDVEKAIERLEKAVADNEKIAIYGDYDVDGVTSVTILDLYLKKLGAQVEYYIPTRDKEGYGVSTAGLDILHEHGVTLVVTVDTGITANEETRYAKSLGMEMIVTDHHECQKELPDAVAVINPHRPDSSYPFRDLAGVGVVFKFICAFELHRAKTTGLDPMDCIKQVCLDYGDLVAVGTIADVMPLIDENRLIVTLGLKLINSRPRPGMAALISASTGSGRRKVTTNTIGYGLAPRLNAAGRMDSATRAVRLLLETNPGEAAEMAKALCEINAQRQQEVNIIDEEARELMKTQCDLSKDRFVVLSKDDWKPGVIGIVVSRITDTLGLPAILISFEGTAHNPPEPTDQGKGSGRSVRGINLVKALQTCEDILVRYGGHELAAGLTVERDRIPELRRRLNAYVEQELQDGDIVMEMEAECELSPDDLTLELANEIERLEPCGTANPMPLFILRGARIDRIMEIKNKHVKLFLDCQGRKFTAMWFSKTAEEIDFVQGERADLLFQCGINDFQNLATLQLTIQDMHHPEIEQNEMEYEKKRYAEICAGDRIYPEEQIVPTRNDFKAVYCFLSNAFRSGIREYPVHKMLFLLNQHYINSLTFNYAKLVLILRIFQELKICGISEVTEDVYAFDIYYSPSKTNIEKSMILKQIRGQCKL